MLIKKIWFITISMIIFISLLDKVIAQQDKIAIILSRDFAPFKQAIAGFKEVTKSQADIYNMEGEPAKIKKIIETISPTEYPVLVVVGSEALAAIIPYSANRKIFYTMVLDPIPEYQFEQNGVVMKINTKDQYKRIQTMLPEYNRVGVLYNPDNSLSDIAHTKRIVKENNGELIAEKIFSKDEATDGLERLKKQNIQLLWLVLDKTIINPKVIREMIGFSNKNDIPLIGLSMYHVKAGALAAFSIDFKDIGRQTALLVEKTKKQDMTGIKEEPRKVIVYINNTLKQKWKLNLVLENSEIKLLNK